MNKTKFPCTHYFLADGSPCSSSASAPSSLCRFRGRALVEGAPEAGWVGRTGRLDRLMKRLSLGGSVWPLDDEDDSQSDSDSDSLRRQEAEELEASESEELLEDLGLFLDSWTLAEDNADWKLSEDDSLAVQGCILLGCSQLELELCGVLGAFGWRRVLALEGLGLGAGGAECSEAETSCPSLLSSSSLEEALLSAVISASSCPASTLPSSSVLLLYCSV